MKRKLPVFVIAVIAMNLCAHAESEPLPRIAVLDFLSEGISESSVRVLSDRLRAELVLTQHYTVLERDQIEAVLGEVGFQLSGCVATDCIVEAGQLLAATHVLGGAIGRIENVYTLSLRLIDVETGVLVRASVYDTDAPLSDVLRSGIKIALDRILNPETSVDNSTYVSNDGGSKVPKGNAKIPSRSLPQTPINTATLSYITVGSSKDDVLRIQGTPSAMDVYRALGHETWRYGSSYIEISLQTSRVLTWRNYRNTLRVRMMPSE